MKNLLTAVVLLLVAGVAFSQNQVLNSDYYNVNEQLIAIEGYDPVAYITQQKAIKGRKELSFIKSGVHYFFSSEKNRELFKSDVQKYEPVYGGWCAFAMGNSGEKVEVDPETFKIIDGRTYLFYNFYFNNTLKDWNQQQADLKRKGDKNWEAIKVKAVKKN